MKCNTQANDLATAANNSKTPGTLVSGRYSLAFTFGLLQPLLSFNNSGFMFLTKSPLRGRLFLGLGNSPFEGLDFGHNP